MSVQKSVTFSDTDAALAAAVAKFQHRTFSNFVMHCTMAEAKKRIKDVVKAGETPGGTLPTSGD